MQIAPALTPAAAYLLPWDVVQAILAADTAMRRSDDDDDDDGDDDEIPILPNGRPWPPGMLKLRRMLGG